MEILVMYGDSREDLEGYLGNKLLRLNACARVTEGFRVQPGPHNDPMAIERSRRAGVPDGQARCDLSAPTPWTPCRVGER